MNQLYLGTGRLAPDLADNLAASNPHWFGKPSKPYPSFHRTVFAKLYRLLTGAALSPAVALRGPRRVGKTVLLQQVVARLLADGVRPERVFYVTFDELPSLAGLKEPVLAVARWFEQQRLGRTFNEAARADEPAYLLFDEIQNLRDWAPQLKHLVDTQAVRVLVTGSSSLRIEAGRDSIAGRVTTLDLSPLTLREIAGLREGGEATPYWIDNGLGVLARRDFWLDGRARADAEREARQRAFAWFSERGAYPFAHANASASWEEVASFLNETVVQRAIRHDLRVGERGRKRDEQLLQEVFRACCRYAGQTPGPAVFLPDLKRMLPTDVGWNRVRNYLQFLDATMLVRLVPPLEIRLKRRRSPDKICLCDHALRASWLQESVPLTPDRLAAAPELSELAGRLAESVFGYYVATVPQMQVAHFPERGGEPEVDFVLTVGDLRIPVEVKYRRRIEPVADTRGLVAFLEKSVYRAPFGLMITLNDGVEVADPRIIPMSLSSFLWLR
jgi:predicted AAA+ superfamily ATPase